MVECIQLPEAMRPSAVSRTRPRRQSQYSSFLSGYHYFVELVLDRDMAKTGGELYVAVFSNYELLANLSMTTK